MVLVWIKNRINPKNGEKKLETKLICRRAHLSTTVTAAAIAPLKWLLNICIFFHSSSVWYPISSAYTRVFHCGKIALALLLVKDNIVGYIELTTCSTACSFFCTMLQCNYSNCMHAVASWNLFNDGNNNNIDKVGKWTLSTFADDVFRCKIVLIFLLPCSIEVFTLVYFSIWHLQWGYMDFFAMILLHPIQHSMYKLHKTIVLNTFNTFNTSTYMKKLRARLRAAKRMQSKCENSLRTPR